MLRRGWPLVLAVLAHADVEVQAALGFAVGIVLERQGHLHGQRRGEPVLVEVGQPGELAGVAPELWNSACTSGLKNGALTMGIVIMAPPVMDPNYSWVCTAAQSNETCEAANPNVPR